jgi:hypothetical protein
MKVQVLVEVRVRVKVNGDDACDGVQARSACADAKRRRAW